MWFLMFFDNSGKYEEILIKDCINSRIFCSLSTITKTKNNTSYKMKNTFLLCLASAASYAYAENLLDLANKIEEAQIEAEEAAAYEEIVRLSNGRLLTSVDFTSDFYQS